MSNEAELCARALARFIGNARIRGVEIRGAGILTGEAKRTRASQQIQTNPSATGFRTNSTSGGIPRTNPGFERDPSDSGDPNQPERRKSKRTRKRRHPSECSFGRNSTNEPSVGAIQTNPSDGGDRTNSGAGESNRTQAGPERAGREHRGVESKRTQVPRIALVSVQGERAF